MTRNYHTHTFRCHHAAGTEKEYVEEALKNGLTLLGFSDHSPYIFPGDYYSKFRMFPEQTADYYRTLGLLREEYQGRLDIRIGFEMEYYPKQFRQTLEFMAEQEQTLPSGEKAGDKKDGKGYGTDASDRSDRVWLYIRTQVPGILRKADRGKPVQIQRGYGSDG